MSALGFPCVLLCSLLVAMVLLSHHKLSPLKSKPNKRSPLVSCHSHVVLLQQQKSAYYTGKQRDTRKASGFLEAAVLPFIYSTNPSQRPTPALFTMDRAQNNLPKLILHSLNLCVYVHICTSVYMPQHLCGTQKTICRSQFSPATI